MYVHLCIVDSSMVFQLVFGLLFANANASRNAGTSAEARNQTFSISRIFACICEDVVHTFVFFLFALSYVDVLFYVNQALVPQ